MAKIKEEFIRLYVDIVLQKNEPMSTRLLELFDQILTQEFDDNPELMSQFIQSIIDEQTPPEPSELELLQQENEELRQRQEMAEEALLMLSDMILSR